MRIAGDGEPVVFVHGGWGGLRPIVQDLPPLPWTWEWRFADRFRFITYDRRGCGVASVPDSGYDLETQARDLGGVLDYFAVRAAHVIGTSSGVPIALIFATLEPERVRSLTLYGATPLVLPAPWFVEIVRRETAVLREEGPDAAFEKRPDGLLWWDAVARSEAIRLAGATEAALEEERLLVERAKLLPLRTLKRYYVAELRTLAEWVDVDVVDIAAGVDAPTLFVHGAEDTLFPIEGTDPFLERMPNARLHRIEGHGHALVYHVPAAREAAIEFILAQSATPPRRDLSAAGRRRRARPRA